MGELRLIVLVLLGAAISTLVCPPAHGYFERLVISSRAHSMGGAFVSVADDPSAVILNPAGLTGIPTASVLSTISEPYGLTDLGEYYLGAALPTKFGTFGMSWHRFALENVTSEDLFTVAFGRDLIRTSQDASLSVGASLDIARVSYKEYLSDSKTVVTGGLAFLLRPFPIIGVGYSVRNIGSPSFDFVGPAPEGGVDGGKTTLEMTHTFGFAYHWDRKFAILYERERDQDGRWIDRIGVEVLVGERLRIRSGLLEANATGGIGVKVSNVVVDAGVTAHEVLGLSYLVSVGLSLPPGDDGGGEDW